MKIVPPSRPGWPIEKIVAELSNAKITAPVSIVGVRGYYRDSMGEVGRNDIGIYDDAMFVVSGSVFAAFNANTDPSVSRAGVAKLALGTWWYKLGIHGLSKPKDRQYPALVQAKEVTVLRYPTKASSSPIGDTGWFGINIHHGSYGSTSSLGCVTIFPDQWNAFYALVRGEMKRTVSASLPFLLIEKQG